MSATRAVTTAILAVAALLRGATVRGWNVPRRAWWERTRGGGRADARRRRREWRQWCAGTIAFPPGWGDCATAQPGGPVPRRVRRGNVARKAARKRFARAMKRNTGWADRGKRWINASRGEGPR